MGLAEKSTEYHFQNADTFSLNLIFLKEQTLFCEILLLNHLPELLNYRECESMFGRPKLNPEVGL